MKFLADEQSTAKKIERINELNGKKICMHTSVCHFVKKLVWREQEHGTKSIRCMHNVTFQLKHNVIYWDFIYYGPLVSFSPLRFALLFCSFSICLTFCCAFNHQTGNKLFAMQFMIVRIKLNKRHRLQNHFV